MSDAREAREMYEAIGDSVVVAESGDTVAVVTDMGADMAERIAKALNAQHPADEGEQIDEAWLESLGFELNGAFWELPISTKTGYPTKVSVMPSVSEWTVFLIQAEWKGDSDEADWEEASCIALDRITTRGQLRQLLSALGIGK